MKPLLQAIGIVAALIGLVGTILILAMSEFPLLASLGLLTLAAALFVCGLKRLPHHGESRPRVHLPGLDGLRFFAAFLVIIHHIEQAKLVSGLDSLWSHRTWGPFFLRAGGLGVSFFFVLSGFLITYLLLVELAEARSICIKAFYMRRALRIWPVYFVLTLFSFLILPHWSLAQPPTFERAIGSNYWPKFGLFILMWVHVQPFGYGGGIFPA